MNKLLPASAIACGALLLSACGGGGGGDGGSVALESKDDALRELYLVVGPLSDYFFTGEFFPSEDAAARAMSAKSSASHPKAAQPCSRGMGTFNAEPLVGTYNFRFFDAAMGEGRERLTWVNCLDEGNDFRTTTNGENESGLNGDYFYAINTDYEERYVEQARGSPSPSFSSTLRRGGILETRFGETETLQRALLSYSYEDSETHSVEVQLGSGAVPFKLVSSQNLRFDGDYSYSTHSCRGGAARVTTLVPLQRSLETGQYTQGRIKLEAGGRSAEFTLGSPSGGARLVLNGVTQDLGAAEIAVLTEIGRYCH